MVVLTHGGIGSLADGVISNDGRNCLMVSLADGVILSDGGICLMVSLADGVISNYGGIWLIMAISVHPSPLRSRCSLSHPSAPSFPEEHDIWC